MWLISWPSTPSSSSRFMISRSPVVAVMAARSGLIPVAKALGEGSSITYTAGLGMPPPMASSSTRLWSWRWRRGAGARVGEERRRWQRRRRGEGGGRGEVDHVEEVRGVGVPVGHGPQIPLGLDEAEDRGVVGDDARDVVGPGEGRHHDARHAESV